VVLHVDLDLAAVDLRLGTLFHVVVQQDVDARVELGVQGVGQACTGGQHDQVVDVARTARSTVGIGRGAALPGGTDQFGGDGHQHARIHRIHRTDVAHPDEVAGGIARREADALVVDRHFKVHAAAQQGAGGGAVVAGHRV